MSQMYKNSIFWVDVNKVSPNPFQPRRQFHEEKLRELADSIRQYGHLQPLVVTRREETKEDGGLSVSYQLIAGERRLRASKIAGVSQVPVIIREGTENDDQLKLELAIIENIQREELNPIDRAKAFKQLIDQFGFKHTQVAQKVGKSREYVSNSVRLLALPEEVIDALTAGKITEGHARPLLMLSDNPDEQAVLFKEIIFKKLTVREAERIARYTAQDKVRKRSGLLDPEMIALQERLTTGLGTRVQIEKRENGGKITIDFTSSADLRMLLDKLEQEQQEQADTTRLASAQPITPPPSAPVAVPQPVVAVTPTEQPVVTPAPSVEPAPVTTPIPAMSMAPAPAEQPQQAETEVQKALPAHEHDEATMPPVYQEHHPVAVQPPVEESAPPIPQQAPTPPQLVEAPKKAPEDDDLYSMKNFSV